jgi:hypothetical protein
VHKINKTIILSALLYEGQYFLNRLREEFLRRASSYLRRNKAKQNGGT